MSGNEKERPPTIHASQNQGVENNDKETEVASFRIIHAKFSEDQSQSYRHKRLRISFWKVRMRDERMIAVLNPLSAAREISKPH
jgi:hypothetical protein